MKPLTELMKDVIRKTENLQVNQTTFSADQATTILNQVEILDAQANQDIVLAEILLNQTSESEETE